MKNNNGTISEIQLRRCVSCYEKKPRTLLFRVVRCEGGAARFDKSGKADGRGAYVCKNEKCVSRALKEKRFERSLKASLQQDMKEILENELRQGGLLDGDHQ